MRSAARHAPILAVLVTFAAASPLAAQPASAAQLTRYVDSVAAAALAQGKSAGVSIAVARGSTVLLAKGYGLADLENAVPVTDASVFRIASLTKQFTAAAVLELAERGRLSLDDDLARWIPAWPRYDQPVTIRQLLSHTSGIHDWNPAVPTARPIRLDLARDVHDSVLAPMRADTLHFVPGTTYEYSNAGYHLLGLIVEKASGQSYAAYLAEHVFRPLGLRSTTYCETAPLVMHRAHGYRSQATGSATSRAPSGFVNAADLDMNGVFSAGALCSTGRDLVVWARALASGQVVSRECYRRMTTPRTVAPDKPQYGFGLALGTLAGHAVVSHGGGINGFSARLASYPADSLVVAVLTNTETFAPDPLEHGIAARALGLPDPAPKDLPITAAEATRLTGVYRAAAYGFTMRVTFDRATLTGVAPGLGRMRLRKQGADTFVNDDDHYIRFRFSGGAGSAAQLEISDPAQTMRLARQ